MTQVLGIKPPELDFSPFPHDAVGLMLLAESAISEVPRMPELLDYDVNGITVPILIRGRTPVPPYFVKSFVKHHELPVDFVSYDDPVNDTTNIVVGAKAEGLSYFEARRRTAREKAGEASNGLLARAEFVAALIAYSNGFEETGNFHASKIDPKSTYARFNFDSLNNSTPPIESTLQNDVIISEALGYANGVEDPVLARSLANLIRHPEFAVLAHTLLYHRGDTGSFSALHEKAKDLYIDNRNVATYVAANGGFESVKDYFDDLIEHAVMMQRPDQAEAFENLKWQFVLNAYKIPGYVLGTFFIDNE